MKQSSVFEQLVDACLAVDNAGCVIFINDAAADLLGQPARDLIGQLCPEDTPGGLPIQRLCATASATRRPAQASHFRSDLQRWLNLRATPAGDAVVLFCFEAHSVAGESQSALEQRLSRCATQLADTTRELEALSYTVSHDLRAPLRHVEAFASLLEQTLAAKTDASASEYVGIILQSAKQMSRLLDGVLSYSRLTRREVNRCVVSLDQAFESVIQELKLEVEGRRVVWQLDPLPEVEADPWMLRQCLSQLVGNALKFTRARDPALISISSTVTADEIVLRIADNGIGFDPQYGDRLFGLFQKLHSDTQYEGAGIGLAHVRRMIQRLGGRIWAEGSPDVGATFFVALPTPSRPS